MDRVLPVVMARPVRGAKAIGGRSVVVPRAAKPARHVLGAVVLKAPVTVMDLVGADHLAKGARFRFLCPNSM